MAKHITVAGVPVPSGVGDSDFSDLLRSAGINDPALAQRVNQAFESKQRELDELRVQAGDDARRLSIELCQAQKETNVLVLEVKKYEGLHKFMDLERDLIMKAQADARRMNPAISSMDVEEAEQRQEELED